MKKILLVLLAIIVAAIIGGCIYLNTLMPIITGYAAKNLASAVFISGREPADVEALDLNFSFIKYNKNTVDYEAKTVTSRFLWAKSTAVFREGYGVTLLRGKKVDELKAEKFPLPPAEAIPERLEKADPAIIERLEPIAKAYVDDQSYGGVPFALVVLHDGKIAAERYREGLGPDTKFLSWSMSKSFTQALTGIMAGDRIVNINAPMNLPQWMNDGRKAITLNNLLRMQAGLEWNENYGNRSDVNLMLHREKDMGLYATLKPLSDEPGTKWLYSSGSINIVMRYLRAQFPSDKEFQQYMRDRLFTPLGISEYYFEPDLSGMPVGSSYLYVTARDYARFGQMYLQDGCVPIENGLLRVLPKGWVEYTTTPTEGSEGRYGSGFWINSSLRLPDVPADTFSCQGHDGQEILIIPSKNMVVVILGFTHMGGERFPIFNALLSDLVAALE